MVLGVGHLMPGFRFHPTDEELVMYYLKRKVMGKQIHGEIISELDIYKFEPSDLPNKACLKSRDLNWYFFCPRGNKYATGGRANRATEFGYWKATGNDRSVSHKERTVGRIKTLIFHRGKPPKGERTDWVLHEYRLDDNTLAAVGVVQDSYVICKIFHKSGLGPKNGEQYGAPLVEEEWEDDESKCASMLPPARCDFGNDANTSATGHYGLAGNYDASITLSSEAVMSMDQVSDHPVETDAGGLGLANSHLITVDEDGIDELDRILATFTGNGDPTMKKMETAEAGGDVFAQLEGFCDWGGLDQNFCLQSPWGNNYLDDHLYLELDDFV